MSERRGSAGELAAAREGGKATASRGAYRVLPTIQLVLDASERTYYQRQVVRHGGRQLLSPGLGERSPAKLLPGPNLGVVRMANLRRWRVRRAVDKVAERFSMSTTLLAKL